MQILDHLGMQEPGTTPEESASCDQFLCDSIEVFIVIEKVGFVVRLYQLLSPSYADLCQRIETQSQQLRQLTHLIHIRQYQPSCCYLGVYSEPPVHDQRVFRG